MSKQINIEDSIFILMMRIRVIRDTITLDAEAELFLPKILDDIEFIDQTSRILLDQLSEGDQGGKDLLFEHLGEMEWQYSQTLSVLMSKGGSLSIRDIPTIKEKLQVFQQSCLERQRRIESISPQKGDPQSSPVVSSNELNELLKVL
ncbi:MAG: hypothetical protein FWH12_02610 [Treponema sp.]|nr:hypothetical protein [Treponema sp.]